MLDAGVLTALRAAVGDANVATDDESRERASFDALGPRRLFGRGCLADARADAVVRPASTAEVAAIMRVACAHSLPVVACGGGTGVMGAVIPLNGGIALDLRRMDRIISVGHADHLARVQPGACLADLASAAEREGLMLGHDPWSVSIAAVGGAISTDSVGYRAGRYGSMGEQVLALEAVLADGTVVRTRPVPRQSSGPQLRGLFAGAEGTMGVITEATIRLFPQPEARAFASFGFTSFAAGYPAVLRLWDIGLTPALLDLTEEDEPMAGEWRCVLHMAFEGYREEVAAQRKRARAELLAGGATGLGARPAQRYWDTRHKWAERWRDTVRPLRPTERWGRRDWRGTEYLHLSLPVSRVLDYQRQANAIVTQHGLTVTETAVWTDPRLFSLFVMDPRRDEPGRDAALYEATGALLTLALAMDGGIEYCHGIGARLLPWAEREWGDALVLARRLKHAVDPQGILNPGKLGL